MIAVDKAVPMPSRPDRGVPRYPWKTMEVGDSFLFPPEIDSTGASARACQARRYGRVFSIRKTDEGVRCWRIA